jgi:hypothetical protein
MDHHCYICTEPWDNEEFHEAAEEQGRSYDTVAADFRQRGCRALHADVRCEPSDDTYRRGIIAAAYDVLGDDMDGAAAEIEDWFAIHPTAEDV